MEQLDIFDMMGDEGQKFKPIKSTDWKWTFADYPKEKNGLKVFSCFACGGGSTMGYKLAGCDVIGCVEIDSKMNDVYVRNHNPKFNYLMDIRDFNSIPNDKLPIDLFNLDILDGSPPCTTFSMAGEREKSWGKKKKFREGQAEQTLDDLPFVFIETAKKLKPKVVIMENVEGLLRGDAWAYVQKIYGDFSGYSDIAIGTAKLFGIKLMRNFNLPYFSRDIAEFWRRWHISLNKWFIDYVYIPLGGSRPALPARLEVKGERLKARYTKWIAVRNTFIIFLLSGFWHGANWTFVLWGAYHALLFVPLLLMNKNRRYRDTVATVTLPDGTIKTKWLPSLKEAGQMLLTFALAVFGWIIFRAQDINQFDEVISTICSDSLFSVPWLMNRDYYIPTILAIVLLCVIEWLSRDYKHGLEFVKDKHQWIRTTTYIVLLFCIFAFGGHAENFIYFQF